MIKDYYIQVGDQSAVNLWDEYGMRVIKTEGLNQLPVSKSVYSHDWKDEQGDDEYASENVLFKSKKIKITFRIDKTTQDELVNKIINFRNMLFSANRLSYFDTYKRQGFSGRYISDDINSEKYRETANFVEFEMEFKAPNGICFAFDNELGESILVNITEGYADLYFSDGFSSLNTENQFVKDQVGGFVIICPSVYGGVEASIRFNKIFGINNKIFGIPNKTYGI